MPLIVSAGAVVSRRGREVLLVHRPKYDDWSFPKGKIDPGEHVVATAVREVVEETGLDVRLGPPLTSQSYPFGNGTKDVHYWAGWVTGGDDVSAYAVNNEVDAVAWVRIDKARKLLTYDIDRDTLAEFEQFRKESHPLIILRHARAVPRSSWKGDDRDRPLTAAGEFQAEHVAPLLAAYGVQRVVSSSSRRCWSTVAPYAELEDLDIEESEGLTEEDGTPASAAEQVDRLLERREPAVLCTHRPLLPWVWETLGIPDRTIDKGTMVVVHHRGEQVVAVEQHDTPFQ